MNGGNKVEEERKKILRMVKEGKLSVEEALVLLDELSKENEGKQEGSEFKESVQFEEAKKEDSINETFKVAKEKVLEIVDFAMQKVKNLDLDLNFTQSTEISHIFQRSEEQIKELDIDITHGNVKIIPWDQTDIRVECDAKVYRTDSEEEARKTFNKNVLFDIQGDKLILTSQEKWMKLQTSIYIPEAQYEKVKVRLFNGSIESENLKATEFSAKTVNGKIQLDRLMSHEADVETANGQIELRDGNVKHFEGETVNGPIKLDGVFGEVDAQSFTGNIVCTVKEQPCEEIRVKSTAGNVRLYVPETMPIDGELKSKVGNLTVTLNNIQVMEEKVDVISKYMKFKSANEVDKTTYIDVDTRTGSITIKGLLEI